MISWFKGYGVLNFKISYIFEIYEYVDLNRFRYY